MNALTAQFANPAFETQTKTVPGGPELGHDWGAPEYEWSDDNAYVTARRICANNSEHVEMETVDAAMTVLKEATYEEDGEIVYTSGAFTNEAFAVQEKTEFVPRLQADGVLVTKENFPDESFLAYVEENLDTDGDGVLSEHEVTLVTSIDVSGQGITSLAGIESFTELQTLDCSGNGLADLDLSTCGNLETLNCSGNDLTGLDLSACGSLETLDCSGNGLTGLDLSACGNLEEVDCSGNELTTLEVSECPKLTYLNCAENKIAALDVSANMSLANLNFRGNIPTIVVEKKEETIRRLPGDADGNDSVETRDVLRILQKECGQDVTVNEINADVNADGKADLSDALIIMKNGCGWSVSFR